MSKKTPPTIWAVVVFLVMGWGAVAGHESHEASLFHAGVNLATLYAFGWAVLHLANIFRGGK